MGNSKDRIRGDVVAPVRFFTPFPYRLLDICGSALVYLSSAFEVSTLKKVPHILFSRAHTVLDARLRRIPSEAMREG
jgi:hypothetical protein